MPKFKPSVLLDEQMYLSGDTQNTLLYQIREEAKETNRLLQKLVEQKEEKEAATVEVLERKKAAISEVEEPKTKKKNK
ncbi:MAG: hypothetical protein K0Q87_77 [Neobacillus sp.]|jgi:hypothetical protein|nr:hypothetical protein [Neobacillus sp.]